MMSLHNATSQQAQLSFFRFFLVYLQLSEVLVQKEKVEAEGLREALSPLSTVLPVQKQFRFLWEGKGTRAPVPTPPLIHTVVLSTSAPHRVPVSLLKGSSWERRALEASKRHS